MSHVAKYKGLQRQGILKDSNRHEVLLPHGVKNSIYISNTTLLTNTLKSFLNLLILKRKNMFLHKMFVFNFTYVYRHRGKFRKYETSCTVVVSKEWDCGGFHLFLVCFCI